MVFRQYGSVVQSSRHLRPYGDVQLTSIISDLYTNPRRQIKESCFIWLEGIHNFVFRINLDREQLGNAMAISDKALNSD
jgi:hypothetical protein